MMRQSWRLGALAAVGAVTLALSACATGGANDENVGTSTEEDPQSGGVVRISSFAEMPGFDPINVRFLGMGVERAANVFDTLLYRDEITDEVSPRLAKGMTTEDGVTWVMELREGVEFTDGTPLNADAVIFNTERHLAEDSPSSAKAFLSNVTSMEATGEYEVTFTLSGASGSFPLAFTASSPAGLIGSPTALADPEAFNTNPVGAGPFKVQEWVRDSTLTFVKNEDYWEEGLPYLDGLEYLVLPEPQVVADSLVSGNTHLGQVYPQNMAQVGEAPGITVVPPAVGGQVIVPNNSTPPTDDPRVREALFSVFDPQTTMDVVFSGSDAFTPEDFACLPFAAGSPGCAPDAVFDFDMERAASLIEDYVADGGDPTLSILTEQGSTDIATYMLQQFEAIGVNATLRLVDSAGLGEARVSGDYDVLLDAASSAGSPTVWTRYSSTGSNWGRVVYPELEAALGPARDAVELEDRNAAWREVANIIHDNAILQWFMPNGGAMTHSDKLHLGLPGHPYTGSMMVYYNNAWLED